MTELFRYGSNDSETISPSVQVTVITVITHAALSGIGDTRREEYTEAHNKLETRHALLIRPMQTKFRFIWHILVKKKRIPSHLLRHCVINSYLGSEESTVVQRSIATRTNVSSSVQIAEGRTLEKMKVVLWVCRSWRGQYPLPPSPRRPAFHLGASLCWITCKQSGITTSFPSTIGSFRYQFHFIDNLCSI